MNTENNPFAVEQDPWNAEPLPERPEIPPVRPVDPPKTIMKSAGGFDEEVVREAKLWESEYKKVRQIARAEAFGTSSPKELSRILLGDIRELRDQALLKIQAERLASKKRDGYRALWAEYARIIGELREELMQHMKAVGVEAKYFTS